MRILRWAGWIAILPFYIGLEIAVTFFDLVLSRLLVAAVVVAVFWLPCHLLFDVGRNAFVWPTAVIGLGLTGLWEGCGILTVRPTLARIGIVYGID